MASDDEYEVGYGRPPKATRFRAGQSGNPNGRKKRASSIQDEAREMLAQIVDVKLNGRVTKTTRSSLIVMRLMQDLTGDNSLARSRALKDLERYVPDFHLPPPAPPETDRKVTIHIVESDNYGGMMNPTDEEKLYLKEMLHQYRNRRRAKPAVPGDAEPDPLDM